MVQVERRPHDGLAFAAVLGFALSLYASAAHLVPALESVRPALATAVIALGMMLFARLAARLPIALDGTRGLALLGFCAWAAASLLWTRDPAATRLELVELVKLAGFYFAAVNLIRTPRRLFWVSIAVLLAALAPALGALERFREGSDLVDGYRARWLGVYADPNHLAMSLVAVVPLALALAAGTRSRLGRVAALASAAAFVAAIVVTHSRGGALGLLVAVALFVLTGARKLRALALAAALAGGVAALAPGTFWKRAESLAGYETDAAARGRIFAWQVAEAIAHDRPLTGVGLGAFRAAWPHYAPPEARSRSFVPHNVFLAALAELGLVGFALYLTLLARTLAGVAAARREEAVQALARAWVSGLAGYLLCALISGYLLSAHLFLLAALAASCERIARSSASRASLAARGPGPVLKESPP